MNLHTAFEVINFAKQLENESEKFYQDLFRRYAEGKVADYRKGYCYPR